MIFLDAMVMVNQGPAIPILKFSSHNKVIPHCLKTNFVSCENMYYLLTLELQIWCKICNKKLPILFTDFLQIQRREAQWWCDFTVELNCTKCIVFVTKFYTMRKILDIISCDKMIIKWQMHSFPCIQQVLHYIYLA